MFTPLIPKKFSDSIFSLEGISKKTIEDHLKLYTGYVNKYNEINTKLSVLTDDDYKAANQVYSLIRELKVELSFAWGGVINHEIYFGHLGDKKGATSREMPEGSLLKQIEKDFGSFELYKRDLKASGIAARGWVWTAWNTMEERLVNYIGDSQNTFLIWHAIPLVALDTYEHAYFTDFGVNRASYIEAFFTNLNWNTVEKRFMTLVK